MSNLVKNKYVKSEEIYAKKLINTNDRVKDIIKEHEATNSFKAGLYANRIEISSDYSDDSIETMDNDSQDDNTFVEGLDNEYNEELLANEGEMINEEGFVDDNSSEDSFPEEQPMEQQYQEEQYQVVQPSEEDVMISLKDKANAFVESAVASAREQADAIKEEAYNQAIEEANNEIAIKEQALNDDFNGRLSELEEEYRCRFENMEQEIVDALIPVFDKVLHVSVSDYRPIIIQLIRDAILKIDNPKSLVITVCEANYQFVKEHMQDMYDILPDGVAVDVLRDETMDETMCKIETENGIIDCGFDTELDNLLKAIKMIS